MKTLCFQTCLLIFFSVFWFDGYAQSDSLKIDSLKKVLQIHHEDTIAINALNALGTAAIKKGDIKNAKRYADDAITISKKLIFKKGEGDSHLIFSSVFYLQDNNYAECEKQLIEAIECFKQAGAISDIIETYGSLGNIYQQEYKYTEALQQYMHALQISKDANDKKGIAFAYFNIGALNNWQSNFPEALKFQYKALKIYEELKDKEGMANVLQDIGYVYYNQGNYPEAFKNHNEALRLNKETGNEWAFTNSLKNVGDVYFKLGNYDEALKNELLVLELAERIRDKSFIAWTYTSIGNIYEKQGETASQKHDETLTSKKFLLAEDYYLKALKMNEEVNFNLEDSYFNLGNIYINLKKYPEAKKSLQKSLDIAKLTTSKLILRDGYFRLSYLDSLEGNYKQAYEHYKLYNVYRDSLFNEETIKKTSQEKMQYDFDKKEAITKAEQDKKDAEAKRIKNQQYFTIAALGIVVLAVIIIAIIQFRNNKHKQQANIALQQQKEKVESTLSELKSTQSQLIQSEKMASLGELTAGIAHEIQNPLNFVNNFSEVNKEMIDELQTELKEGNVDEAINISNDIKANEEKINHHGKRADAIVKGMLQHSQKSAGQKEPTDINALCDEYLRLSYHGLRAKDKDFNADFKTDFDASIGKINIIPQDIGRVLLNLYNNAFYAIKEKNKTADEAYQPTVAIQTKRINDKIEIKVSDNGNGIPQNIIDKIFQPFFTTKPTGQGTGLGLSLSYDIIKAHGGEIKVETKEGNGTMFIINLPAV